MFVPDLEENRCRGSVQRSPESFRKRPAPTGDCTYSRRLHLDFAKDHQKPSNSEFGMYVREILVISMNKLVCDVSKHMVQSGCDVSLVLSTTDTRTKPVFNSCKDVVGIITYQEIKNCIFSKEENGECVASPNSQMCFSLNRIKVIDITKRDLYCLIDIGEGYLNTEIDDGEIFYVLNERISCNIRRIMDRAFQLILDQGNEYVVLIYTSEGCLYERKCEAFGFIDIYSCLKYYGNVLYKDLDCDYTVGDLHGKDTCRQSIIKTFVMIKQEDMKGTRSCSLMRKLDVEKKEYALFPDPTGSMVGIFSLGSFIRKCIPTEQNFVLTRYKPRSGMVVASLETKISDLVKIHITKCNSRNPILVTVAPSGRVLCNNNILGYMDIRSLLHFLNDFSRSNVCQAESSEVYHSEDELKYSEERDVETKCGLGVVIVKVGVLGPKQTSFDFSVLPSDVPDITGVLVEKAKKRMESFGIDVSDYATKVFRSVNKRLLEFSQEFDVQSFVQSESPVELFLDFIDPCKCDRFEELSIISEVDSPLMEPISVSGSLPDSGLESAYKGAYLVNVENEAKIIEKGSRTLLKGTLVVGLCTIPLSLLFAGFFYFSGTLSVFPGF